MYKNKDVKNIIGKKLIDLEVNINAIEIEIIMEDEE